MREAERACCSVAVEEEDEFAMEELEGRGSSFGL